MAPPERPRNLKDELSRVLGKVLGEGTSAVEKAAREHLDRRGWFDARVAVADGDPVRVTVTLPPEPRLDRELVIALRPGG